MATLTKNASPPPKERATPAVQPPINLEDWIEKNRDLFKPPVSNRYLYDGRDFFVMVIKGPNARNDFHKVDSEEYFYQLKGDIKVRIREGDKIVDHLVREGETFFIPPNTAAKITSNTDATIVGPYHRMTSIEKNGNKEPEVYRFYSINEVRETIDKLTQHTGAAASEEKK